MRTPGARVRHRIRDRRVSAVARRVRRDNLTYLTAAKLRRLERCLAVVERQGIAGDVLEAGVALGGSSIVLAATMGPGRRFFGYDVFGMIPAPSERDDEKSHARYRQIARGLSPGLGGGTYYGYQDDLYGQVVRTFERYGIKVDGRRVSLVPGLFEDSLHPPGPVALAHVDCDWYDAVGCCLARISAVLSPGGFIVLDDYFDYGGCKEATHEFLAAEPSFSFDVYGENAVLRRANTEG
jgi:O-methyltransferase